MCVVCATLTCFVSVRSAKLPEFLTIISSNPEAHFNGTDLDGRSTCADRSCPAGTEEDDGRCHPCDSGSFSVAGGSCTKCRPGQYSLVESGNCSECQPGTVSKFAGASECDECPAGKYEIDRQSCSDCPAGFVSLGGNDSCTECPAGSIAPKPGTSTCEPCLGGTSAGAGSSACLKCPPGKYSLTGSSSCLVCLPGTISEVEGALTCDPCPAGTQELNRQSCSPCRSGFVSSGGNSTCTQCLAGFNAPKPGSSTCDPCPAGFFSDESTPGCIPCRAGTVSGQASRECRGCDAGSFPGDSTKCDPCPGGTFAVEGSSACLKCPPGKYSLTGSSSCLVCLAGTISEVEGSLTCDPCPAGTQEWSGFVSLGGNSTCTKCPAGSIAPKPGTSTCEPCLGGTFAAAGSGACQKCPPGTYSLAGSSSCLNCLPGTISDIGASTCELCPAGTQELNHRICQTCPAGSKVSSGTNFSCTKCPAGFVAPKPGSSTCEACLGGFYSEEGSAICIPCGAGTISVPASGRCQECDSGLNFFRAKADETKQSCQIDTLEILLMVISVFTSICFCFLCLTGFHGRVAIADVSAQGEKLVMTAALSHFFLKHSAHVKFIGTGVPNLESLSWNVQALNSFQLTLHCGNELGEGELNQLDTSIGQLVMKFPGPFVHTGLWHCPLIVWCLLFGAASGAAMSRLTWSLTLVVAGLGIFVGALAFAWRRRSDRVGSPYFWAVAGCTMKGQKHFKSRSLPKTDGYNVNITSQMEENYGEAAAFPVRCHQKHLESRNCTNSIDP